MTIPYQPEKPDHPPICPMACRAKSALQHIMPADFPEACLPESDHQHAMPTGSPAACWNESHLQSVMPTGDSGPDYQRVLIDRVRCQIRNAQRNIQGVSTINRAIKDAFEKKGWLGFSTAVDINILNALSSLEYVQEVLPELQPPEEETIIQIVSPPVKSRHGKAGGSQISEGNVGLWENDLERAKQAGVDLCRIPILNVVLEESGQEIVVPETEDTFIDSPKKAAKIFHKCFERLDREHLVALLLSVDLQLLGVNTVSIGQLANAEVHPREVFKPAILGNAHRIYVGHNHPSGSLDPSEADLRWTNNLIIVGEYLSIPVIDSLIVNRHGHYNSRLETGWRKISRCRIIKIQRRNEP